MNEARCSVNWKMFAPNGAQMQFTVLDDDPDLHLALLDSYLSLVPARLQRHRAGAERRRKAGGDHATC